MHFSKNMIRLILVIALASAFAILRIPAAQAAETYTSLQMTNCPTFTGPSWSSPMPPSNSGNQYLLTLSTVIKVVGGVKSTYPPMTCAQAQSWVKKLAAEHIAGKPMMPDYPPLKTGPPNFLCKGSPDSNGHAWRGNCYKKGMNPPPSFTWSNS